MTLRVIGAGFGRTGTMSLKLALEQLGFGPCHHMVEVFAHPDTILRADSRMSSNGMRSTSLMADRRASCLAARIFSAHAICFSLPVSSILLSFFVDR